MKETEFRAKFIPSISPDHAKDCYVIEKRTNNFNSQWKTQEYVTKTENINTAEKALAYYMKEFLNVEPIEDVAYTRIKRL